MTSLRQWFWDRRFVLLLGGLIAILLATPFGDKPGIGFIVLQLAFTALAVLAVLITSGSRGYVYVVLSAVAGWLAISWSGQSGWSGELGWLAAALLIFICCVVFVFVEMSVFRAPVVDGNVLCGGVAGYLLIALVWALSFILIEIFAPGAIKFPDRTQPVWSDLVYFSLTCLTTLGFGDILPIHPFVRIWATMETAAGIIYVAVLVARLVTLYQGRRPS